MALSKFVGDITINGHLVVTTMDLPASSVADASVAPNAAIQVTKIRHLITATHKEDDETDAIDRIVPLYIAKGTSTIRSVTAGCLTAPTSGSEAVTIDVKKGSVSVSPASILSTTMSITTSDADRVVKSGTLAVTALSNEDYLVVDINVSGDDSNVGCQGLYIDVEIDTAAN